MSEPPRRLDHVALLVPDLERALRGARALGLEAEAPQAFPGEGTREAYAGPPGGAARLLLMTPHGPGPYARALERRGPGLHHLALRTPDPRGLVEAAVGWLLHPRSLASWEGCRTLWLARPGVGALIEVAQGAPAEAGPPVIEAVELAGATAALLGSLDPALTPGPVTRLRVAGQWLAARGGLEALG